MFKRAIQWAMPLVMVAPAFSAQWLDFDAAKAEAAKQDKAMLVDFTGSDWCGWCIKLRKEVLDTPAFEAYAKDKFVLAEVDVPNGNKLSPEQKEKNQQLCAQYHVSGFPTIMVMDAQGNVLGGFNGFRGTVEEAAKPLDEALKVQALLQEAKSLEGEAKLAKLLEAYKMIPADLREGATGLSKEIMSLDEQDKAGIRKAAMIREQQAEIQKAFSVVKSPEEALKLADDWMMKAYDENKAGLCFAKEGILLQTAKAESDLDAAKAEALKGVEYLDAETQAKLAPMVEKRYGDKASLFERIQEMQRNRAEGK